MAISSQVKTIPKIGIFGWSGTGKTTYISMFYYLASRGLVTDVIASASSDVNSNSYLSSNIAGFLSSSNWSDISKKITGTIQEKDIFLKISLDGRKKTQIQIKDYRGEDVEVGSSNDNLFTYMKECDTALLFLDASQYGANKVENYNRLDEFNKYLNELSEKNSSNKVTIPIYLIVSKMDELGFDLEYEDMIETARNQYGDIIKNLDRIALNYDVFYVSSKICFEKYVLSDESEACADLFCSPIIRSVKHINTKAQNKKIKNVSLFVTVFFLTLVAIYASLATYYNYRINTISNKTNVEAFIELSKYKLSNNRLRYFPFLEETMDEELVSKRDQAENDLYRSAISEKNRDNYNIAIKSSNRYLEIFPNGRHVEEIKKIIDFAWEKAEKTRVSSIQSKVPDYSLVIKLSNDYLRDFPAGNYKSEVDNLLKEAMKVENIFKYDSSMMYDEVINLCGDYKDIYQSGSYLNVISEQCNAAISQKQLEQKKYELAAQESSSSGTVDIFFIIIFVVFIISRNLYKHEKR